MTRRSKIYFGLIPRRRRRRNITWATGFIKKHYKEIADMANQKWYIEVDEKFNDELLKALYG